MHNVTFNYRQDWDSYFEIYMLYHCRLLILKHEGDKICTLTTILQYKHLKAWFKQYSLIANFSETVCL